MRVAVWHDLPSGGGLRAMGEQVRQLRLLGNEVRIWSPGTAPRAAIEWAASSLTPPTSPAVAEKEGIADRRFGARLDLTRRRVETLMKQTESTVVEIRDWNADVVLAHPSWLFFSSPVGRLWDGPSVLYLQEPNRALHEANPENVWALPEFPQTRSLRKRLGAWIRDNRAMTLNRMLVHYEINWARSFDVILVNSFFSRESVLRSYGIDAEVCPLGADHSVFGEQLDVPKNATVISVGELAPHKGGLLVVEAIATIPEHIRPPLVWYANRVVPEYLAQIQERANQLKVSVRVEHAKSDLELRETLAGAACFVYCPRLEPFGLAPLEANLCGTAVVAVAEGGVRETIIPAVNGYLAPKRDPRIIGELIQRFVVDLQLAKEMGISARTHALQHHTWDSAGLALQQVLEKVCLGHRAVISHQSYPGLRER